MSGEVGLACDLHVEEDLGERRDPGDHLGERASVSLPGGEEHQPGEQAVTGGRQIPEDDMAGLLAAENVVASHHLLEDVLVADGCPDELDPLDLEPLLQPHVAHDCGDDRVVPQNPPALQVAGREVKDVVAVEQAAGLVHCQAAVGIAVEGQAETGAGPADALSQCLRVQ